MTFSTLSARISLSTYGTLYGGLPGLVDNPLGYVEAYIYERPILRLDMPALPLYYYDISLLKGGIQIIKIRYSNDRANVKYLDLTELLSANFTMASVDAPDAHTSKTSTSYNDFTLLVEVYDNTNTMVTSDSTTLRACLAFNGTKAGWLPTELRMIGGLKIPVAFNANGTYTLSFGTGLGAGSVSVPMYAYYNFTDRHIITVTNSSHTVTETAVVRHVSSCNHIQLYWLSKEAGAWKSYAFEVVSTGADANEITPYLHFYTRHEGKRHVVNRQLVARACTYYDYLYIRDIFTSDYVFEYYNDTFAINPTEIILRVSGSVSDFPINRQRDIELTAIVQEGDWL